ncbi:hypothetical protein HOM50_03565 [bacterium]|nr:hypothetical protein [bacterium]MBT5015456.1 hypothetical protein [bacterium]
MSRVYIKLLFIILGSVLYLGNAPAGSFEGNTYGSDLDWDHRLGEDSPSSKPQSRSLIDGQWHSSTAQYAPPFGSDGQIYQSESPNLPEQPEGDIYDINLNWDELTNNSPDPLLSPERPIPRNLSTNNQPSFQCTHCTQRPYATQTGLRQHKKRKHEGVTYPCPDCNHQPFADQSGLWRHQKAKHQGVTYPCPHCNHQPFADPSCLRRHKKTKHADILQILSYLNSANQYNPI